MVEPARQLGRVLLDTSVLIRLGASDLSAVVDAEPVIAAISIGELAFGLDVADATERLVRAQRFATVLAELEILPFDLAAAHQYGLLASLVRRSGRNPRPRRLDLQIAATAAANGLPLVTHNAVDFGGLDGAVTVIGIAT